MRSSSAFYWNLSYIIAVTHDRVHCYWNWPLKNAFLQVWVIGARQDNRWKSVLTRFSSAMTGLIQEGYLLTLPFYAATPSTCPPPLSTQSWQRRSMSWTARLSIAGSLRKASTSCRTQPRNSSRSRWGVASTLFFKCPQRSHGVKSGLMAMTRSPKSSLSRSRTPIRRCAGAPSWAHQSCLKTPWTKSAPPAAVKRHRWSFADTR